MKQYVFDQDWFTHNIPHLRKNLILFQDKPNLRFLEIGSHEGRSTVWFLENILSHPTSTITCIDPFYPEQPAVEEHFYQNVEATGQATKVSVAKGFSNDFLPFYPRNSFDCIYIDGCHTRRAVIEDAVFSFLLLKSGGILIFDDYKWKVEEDSPKIAIDAFLKIYSGQYELLHKSYQVVVRKQ